MCTTSLVHQYRTTIKRILIQEHIHCPSILLFSVRSVFRDISYTPRVLRAEMCNISWGLKSCVCWLRSQVRKLSVKLTERLTTGTIVKLHLSGRWSCPPDTSVLESRFISFRNQSLFSFCSIHVIGSWSNYSTSMFALPFRSPVF